MPCWWTIVVLRTVHATSVLCACKFSAEDTLVVDLSPALNTKILSQIAPGRSLLRSAGAPAERPPVRCDRCHRAAATTCVNGFPPVRVGGTARHPRRRAGLG
ncbi:hypothetical protein BST45_12260 [Mycobacterium shinjukuense]|uniref:Uncharacterized protein n=1 Tax=Mycobacterium shinjukuense TaxID=398694 RepID=A0A7I7MMM4_9MYCO|nr:hypothetical protein BST45_12260 [Mycobacterium shinjukuense]BBX73406.1 hypothetical protein MSHI_13120 [Mycobacterium shinjukuense]